MKKINKIKIKLIAKKNKAAWFRIVLYYYFKLLNQIGHNEIRLDYDNVIRLTGFKIQLNIWFSDILIFFFSFAAIKIINVDYLVNFYCSNYD